METMGMMTAERTAENAITERGLVGAGLPPRARHARGGVQRVTAPIGDGAEREEDTTTAPATDGAAHEEVTTTAPATNEAEREGVTTTVPATDGVVHGEVATTSHAGYEAARGEVTTTAPATVGVVRGEVSTTMPAGDEAMREEVPATAPAGDGAEREEVTTTAPTLDEVERGEVATATPTATFITAPTTAPTATPTTVPTTVPTAAPTTAPTTVLTTMPTATSPTAPTATPTATPTAAPTTAPTPMPTAEGEGETRAESARGIKRWILLLMRMGELPERLCDKIDERIERLALDPFGQTKKQYEKILSLTDVKGRIINLKLMRELLVGGLDPAQTFLLTRYAMGYSAAQLAADLDIKESTMYKRVRTAIGRAAAMLERAGFSESRLDDEYASMPAIKGIMKVFRR